MAGYKTRMLLDPEEVGRLEAGYGKAGRHTDPKLGHRRTFLRFIARMHEIGLVKFVRRCHERVGVFVVWKNGREKMRVILDCRASNRHFRQPPSTELLSSEGFSRIAVEGSCAVDVGHFMMSLGIADVKDCFHRMQLEGDICE